MLQIILLLLKIIGILLLAVLGLILLVLLTTLFVPIRYDVAVEHGEKMFYLKGRVHWLLHLVHLSLSHIEGSLLIRARLFGFVIFDNQKPRKPRKKKAGIEKRKEERYKASKNKASKTNEVMNTRVEKKTAENGEVQDKSKEIKGLESGAAETNASECNITENKRTESGSIKDLSTQSAVVLKESPHTTTEHPQGMIAEKDYRRTEGQGQHREETSYSQPKSIFHRQLERLRRIKDKMVAIFLEWKAKLSRFFQNVSSVRAKLQLIMDFFRDGMNKEGMHLTFSSLKKLLKHVLPTKLQSKLIFGTGDPCSTGQALGAISILYSFYGDKLQITPDFEREIFEGKHFAKGRIRLITILIIVVKLIFDKRFKQLKNNFIILKEAL